MSDMKLHSWELNDTNDSRFRLLVDSIEDYAIIMLDVDGKIRSWNAGATKIKGYQKEEVLGQHFSMFYSEEAKRVQFPDNQLARAALHGHLEDEGWRRRKDGSEFWANILITALYNHSGELEGYSKVVKDMSERKRIEERFRRVVESAPNAMVMINPQGQIEMVNTQAERLFNYPREEMLGQKVEILVPDRFRHGHPEKRGMFLHAPQSRPMGAGRDLYGRRKDGSEFPVEIGLNPIETDEGMMVLSSIVDISERKRLEERFRRVVESAPNAMVMVNSQGRIEMVNTQAEMLFDYSRAEMLGQLIEILVPERFRHDHPNKRQIFFGDLKSRPMGAGRDLFGRRKDGSEFPIEIGLNPIETEDGMMVLSSIVDISDRKQKEQRIQEALQEKDLLLGEIHHRVKNNLQVVHSLLSLQSSLIEDEAVKNMLMDSQNRIQSMALIHQTLYQSNNFARVDFGDFLEALIPSLMNSYAVSGKQIDLTIDASDVYLPINSAIPCGLLINELITNSLKHAFLERNDGEIRVIISEVDDNTVQLIVNDNGSGISAALDLEAIDTLGLRLVNLLSQQLNGDLQIQRSNPTQFSLRFPLGEN
ncbi:PAS domain S-box protein [Undibacterium flavidum]|uniref:PAS domain S-box protein n=1 Tax=Undibacterium flavidum TaxID=2762297 RepID=A0ABR6YDM0_9BURK|nr:PAS domain S-box protein [Undibacterium flavidum]MBC3874649.1 PAS domain S-box protein [Undibacterium flavidum]